MTNAALSESAAPAHSPPRPETAYRADIDGLRAVAVLAVVAFHFFPEAFQGGFIGVDIFFVISGYLITRNILGGLASGRFGLLDFYARRARRIFPGLFVTLLVCLAVGWAILYDDEYRQLGRHAAGGAGFVANVLLWQETGYFDTAAETKPLMHLWSLGVEEQFYLVWPLLLIGLLKLRGAAWATAAVLLASFALSVVLVGPSPAAAFYLPLPRFWELMAGALLAQVPQPQAATPRRASQYALAGATLLALGFLLIHSGSAFPGAWALLPVVGAALLIAAGPQAPFSRHVLAARPMVAVGLISFPLYLWHWPVLSFWKIVSSGAPLGAAQAAVLLPLAFALAWATYAFVEKPIRHGGQGWRKAGAMTASLAVAGVLGWMVQLHEGVPDRVVGQRPAGAAHAVRTTPESDRWLIDDCGIAREQAALLRRCQRDGRAPYRFALVGDSKAEALLSGVVLTSGPAGRWLFMGGARPHTNMVPVISEHPGYARFHESARLTLAALKADRQVETVVLTAAMRNLFQLPREDSIEDLPASAYGGPARDGLGRFVRELVLAGKQVVLVVDNPALADPRHCLTTPRLSAPGPLADLLRLRADVPGCQISVARHLELAAPYHRLLQAIAAEHPGRVTLLDTLPLLCDLPAGQCRSRDGNRLLYSYTDHVSDYAAARIGARLNQLLTAPRAAP